MTKKYTGPEWDVIHVWGSDDKGYRFTLNVKASKRDSAGHVEVIVPKADLTKLVCMKCKKSDCSHTRFVGGYLARKGGPKNAHHFFNNALAYLSRDDNNDGLSFS